MYCTAACLQFVAIQDTVTSMRAYKHDINTYSEDRVATLMRSSSQTLFDEIINRLKSLMLHTSNHKENLEEAKGPSKGRINIVITADVIKVFTKISLAGNSVRYIAIEVM